MEPSFWQRAWDDGRIAFHEGAPNELLVQFHAHLQGAARVLVPLCGKTEDLAWLAAQGHEVVGIELVADAAQAFFAEHAITPTIAPPVDGITAYTAGAVSILVGDFFAASPAHVGAVDAVYDRAAMVALPEGLRGRYVEHVRGLAAPGARILLVTLDYLPGVRQGPPFAITPAEVHARYAGATIELLVERPDRRPVAGGQMLERCFALTL